MISPKRLAIALLVCLAAGGLLALWLSDALRPGPAAPRSVLFVLIDTLRRDHVSTYGYPRKTTPFLDEMAQTGTVFERAVAQAPWTAPSMASIWTSRYPGEVGVGAPVGPDGRRRIDWQQPAQLGLTEVTLAGELRRRGYFTAAVTTNILASDRFGLLRGFDVKLYEKANAEQAVDRLIAILTTSPARSAEVPFFAYLHLLDAHQPLAPPPPFDTMFPTRDGKPHAPEHATWRYRDGARPGDEAYEDYLSHKLALYDGAIAYIDANLHRLWVTLGELGLASDTVVVVASDHGEEFWDHADYEPKRRSDPRGGAVGHGHSMFRELLDVPWIVFGRGVPRSRVARQVRNLDIAPTLLGLLGQGPAPQGWRGVDLLGAEQRGSREDLVAFSESIAYGFEAKALQDSSYKYIRYFADAVAPPLLFHVRDDPLERRNLLSARPQIAVALEAALLRLAASEIQVFSAGDALSEEDVEELRALGYVQ